jgi:hypothetical protein
MWVKLSTEYVNLDHVFRVRFNKAFRNGVEEWAAEVDSIDPKGQIGTITRFRGADAQLLQALLNQRSRSDSAAAVGVAEPADPAHAMTGTVADLQLP